MNSISPIPPLEALSPVLSADQRKEARVEGKEFSNILAEAIHNAAQTDMQDENGMVALLSGADVEPHETMIESVNAELALNLAIQIRNKVIDAYNEVLRMQI